MRFLTGLKRSSSLFSHYYKLITRKKPFCTAPPPASTPSTKTKRAYNKKKKEAIMISNPGYLSIETPDGVIYRSGVQPPFPAPDKVLLIQDIEQVNIRLSGSLKELKDKEIEEIHQEGKEGEEVKDIPPKSVEGSLVVDGLKTTAKDAAKDVARGIAEMGLKKFLSFLIPTTLIERIYAYYKRTYAAKVSQALAEKTEKKVKDDLMRVKDKGVEKTVGNGSDSE